MKIIQSLLLAATCSLAMPAAAQGGVTLFEHQNFGGASESFTTDVARLSGTDIGNDRASSVRVAPGCTAVLYRDIDFRGPATTLRSDTRLLTGTEVGNDAVSSLRVSCTTSGPHGVTLHSDAEFRGRRAVFYEDTPDLTRDGFPDNSASSIEVPDGCSVTLYEHPDYAGRSETFYEDDPLLSNNPIGNDVVSSLRIRCSGAGGAAPVDRGVSMFRCLDRDSSVAFRISETGRDRGQASLFLADTEVATFQARRLGNAWELTPTGRADTTLRIDPTAGTISLGERRDQRTLCRWR